MTVRAFILTASLAGYLALTSSGVAAEIRQDFEERLPGRESAHWRHNWGKKGDDLLIISSDTAASGTQSLMLDRVTGTNEQPWSAVTPLPSAHQKGHRVRFAFRYEGIGSAACPSFEFRAGASKQVLKLKWSHNRLVLISTAKRMSRKETLQVLPKMVASRWYLCDLTLSTGQGDEAAAAMAKLYEYGATESLGSATVRLPSLKNPPNLLYLQVPAGKRGFRFYLDQIMVSPLRQMSSEQTPHTNKEIQ